MNNPYTTDGRDLRVELSPYLHEGEKILWVGQPYTTAKFKPNPATLLFMLFWTGFAVFWTVTASAAGGAFGLFGLPFLAVGFFMLYTITIGSKKRMQNTIYAVTDRRAILLTNGRTTNMTEYIFSRLPSISLENVRGTTGTIRFQSEVIYHNHRSRYGRRSSVTMTESYDTAFVAIDDVQKVYNLISERISSQNA